ncbi:hypothetical protein [Streptococcus pseudopneumoniae]|uniref:hypothetical protein n=1 Tax=Streptococcus pseudopneumoniae TaxID=257758 RepID=UPI00080BD4CF|nr:hypothetical protein [Streptococcus pseudopneumoniae]
MVTEQINQALRMTINELSTASTNTMIENNFSIVQLNDQKIANQELMQENNNIKERINEFEAVLEYDPALKELFEETQAKMKGTN